MTRRPEFKVTPPKPKPTPAVKRVKSKLPSLPAVHATLGKCRITSVRWGTSGAWIVDATFGTTKRTLQLREEYWLTAVGEILLSAPRTSSPTLPVEKEVTKASAPAEDAEDRTPELDEPDTSEEEASDLEEEFDPEAV